MEGVPLAVCSMMMQRPGSSPFRKKMEGVPMVSSSRGSMNSLIHKLTELMKNGDREIQVLPRAHVEGLLEALTGLSGRFVDKVAGRHETDERVKAWMKQVRQLVVDIEDWVDSKLVNMQELENENFEDFILRIDEACERCTRYKLLNTAPADPAVPIEPHRVLLEEKPAGLVGVNGPTEEIVKQLTKEHEKMLKVVSIVGMEGLGKTTLAKEIYAKLQGKFDCHAFVSVGRRTPMSIILRDILGQVQLEADILRKKQLEAERKANHVRRRPSEAECITDLRDCLETKRYLIIIDGVWSTWDWKIIDCALPDKNLGSRVLTTTCIMNVAKCCSIHPSDVHEMKALSKVDSKEIFYGEMKALSKVDSKENFYGEMKALSKVDSKEIFDGEMKAFKGVDSKGISDGEPDILKICGGMPLAIIVAAGSLPRKSTDLPEPVMIGKSDSTSEGMTKILYMSYADLSVPLKSCFMYLSAFPEGYTIKKDRLIRLWRAEGFIPETGSMWETGERYFNELISRRLIQPVFGNEDDQAVGCTVHGVVLDFMLTLSREENFLTVGAELKLGSLEKDVSWSLMAKAGAELMSGPFLCYETVRRLSLHHREECKEDRLVSHYEPYNLVSFNVQLSRVRSLIAFVDSLFMGSVHLPDLKEFELIRVLDLEGSNFWRTNRIIGNLSLLRYLGLAGSNIVAEDIENIGGLDHLQTLDVRRTRVKELPSRMHLMPNLVSVQGDSLRFSGGTSGSLFENVQNLEELSTINVTDCITRDVVARLLIRSKKLRMLGVIIPYSSNTEDVIPFLDDLRVYNLESLVIQCTECPLLDEWAPSPKLRRFRLMKLLGRVPGSWASLHSLTHLDFKIRKIEARDVLVLGNLPNLIVLKLFSLYRGKSGIIASSVGFQSLEMASFGWVFGGMALHFEDGAMPKLRKLRLKFNAGETMKKITKFPPNLMRVDVTINCYFSGPMEVEDVQRAIRKQISDHPRKINLSFELIDQDPDFE